MSKLKYDLDKTIKEYELFREEIDISLALMKLFKLYGPNKFKKMFAKDVLDNFWYWKDDTILSHEDFITEFCQDIANSIGNGISWTCDGGTIGSSSLVLLFDSSKVKFYLSNEESAHNRHANQNKILRKIVKRTLNSIKGNKNVNQ